MAELLTDKLRTINALQCCSWGWREKEREKKGGGLPNWVSLSLPQSLHLSVLCPGIVSVLWNGRSMLGLGNIFPGRMSWQVATVCVCIRGWNRGRGLQIVPMNLCECLCSGGTGGRLLRLGRWAVWGQCAAKLLTHFPANTNTQWERQETMFCLSGKWQTFKTGGKKDKEQLGDTSYCSFRV